MSGKIIVSLIVAISLISGVAIYWLQLYAFYDPVDAEAEVMRMTNVATDQAEEIIADGLEGIDANSSPLRFRACFTTPSSLAMLTETYVIHEDPTPLTAPGWFECFDAETIGHDLEQGQAVAFLGERNIRDGVDRIIAVYPDGRAFAWHQLNEKYDE
ncbi:DUF6446 family protein [Aliiroseovarius sp.]|uniref:DUF6446 family protein n=1 Tax=Aliiroseovarius sp. TaxID=1872442 RepID=UPI00261548A3|nr:DUF6446 family protein [Aliiroseovarius sp.]